MAAKAQYILMAGDSFRLLILLSGRLVRHKEGAGIQL